MKIGEQFNPNEIFNYSNSVFIPDEILKLKELNASDKLIYGVLSKPDNYKNLSFGKLSECCGLPVNQIKKSIKKLQELNIIRS